MVWRPTKFNVNPTGMVIPGPEDQAFLRGLLAGSGISTTGGTFAALFFNANAYSPGQIISNATLPKGVIATTGHEPTGNDRGMTEANADYFSPVYSAFTDFGTPAAGGIPATPGYSGVQGSNGELLIGSTCSRPRRPRSRSTRPGPSAADLRRLEDIAFDQYGYFSQNIPSDLDHHRPATTRGTVTSSTTAFTVTLPPAYAGSLFVTDLATGLSVTVTSVAEGTAGQPGFIPAGVQVVVPIQGPATVGVQLEEPDPALQRRPPIRWYRSSPTATRPGDEPRRPDHPDHPAGRGQHVRPGLQHLGSAGRSSFIDSELSITFSADGTTLWASDIKAIWQFKTTASLADSTTGTLIGLNDLRTLGVPYDGQDSAVAVVDTGVDGQSPPFRGRVATGTNIWTGGPGNQDLAAAGGTTRRRHGRHGGTGTTTGQVLANTFDGHGTPVAGVVAQFVPQATIEPVTIFDPFVGSVRS